MTRKTGRMSEETFDDFLAEQGLLASAEERALKEIIADRLFGSTNTRKLFLALVCFLGILLCASKCSALEVLHIKPSTLRLSGEIVIGDLQKIQTADQNIEELELNLSGGDVREAVRIGRYIHQKRFRLTVVGICASGCAQYLLAASKSVYIRHEALVFFHHYPFVLFEQAKRLGFQISETEEDAIAAEKSFLQDFNVPEDIGYQAFIELAPKCIEQRLYNGQIFVRYDSPFRGWIPQKEYLNSVGIKFQGYWPETMESLVLAFKARFSDSKTNFSIRFSFQKDRIPRDEALRILATIPRCQS